MENPECHCTFCAKTGVFEGDFLFVRNVVFLSKTVFRLKSTREKKTPLSSENDFSLSGSEGARVAMHCREKNSIAFAVVYLREQGVAENYGK